MQCIRHMCLWMVKIWIPTCHTPSPCIFPNKRICSQLHSQIKSGWKNNLTRVKITLQHQYPGILPHIDAVTWATSTFCLKLIFFPDNGQREREIITKVLMLQHQAYQWELQAMVSTFIAEYVHLTGFLDSWICQWSRLLIAFETQIHI